VAALLLVLSMGVDYGVFMVESGRSGEGGSTLVGMLTACLSTVVSFGALAMSANPALRSMGLTAAIGVALALALAPAAWLLLGRRPEPDGTQRSRSDT
jgi:predicted exporter